MYVAAWGKDKGPKNDIVTMSSITLACSRWASPTLIMNCILEPLLSIVRPPNSSFTIWRILTRKLAWEDGEKGCEVQNTSHDSNSEFSWIWLSRNAKRHLLQNYCRGFLVCNPLYRANYIYRSLRLVTAPCPQPPIPKSGQRLASLMVRP